MRRIVRLAALASVGMLGAAVSHAAVTKDTYFNGKTSQNRHVHLTVHGKRLLIFRYTANYLCPGGTPQSGTVETAIPAELKIKGNGSFSHTFKDPNGSVEKISGKFKGKHVSGSFSETFPNGAATCATGIVKYSATRGPRPKPGQP